MRDILNEFYQIHGDNFTYENFTYKNNKQWINITCKKGHKYSTQVLTHLKSKGCQYCRGIKRDRNDILSELNKIHNNLYDYSKSEWNKVEDKIEIICKKHGTFIQSLKLHLKGHHCQKCSNRYKKTNKEFIKSLENRFESINFSISKFINSKTPISAYCKNHGIIKFYPNFKNHVCKKCVDRDTQKFAFKCCSITINGEERDVQKHPLEVDKYGNIVQSFKTSKKGHLKLIQTDNGFETIQKAKDDEGDVMVKVFENGHLLVDYTFDAIRQRAEINFDVEEPEMI